MSVNQTSADGGFDAAGLWLSALRSSGRSPQTLHIYRYAVGQLRAWRSEIAEVQSPLETLTRIEAMAFTRHLLDRFKANGVRTRVKCLRAFYSFCVNEESRPGAGHGKSWMPPYSGYSERICRPAGVITKLSPSDVAKSTVPANV